MGDSANGWGMQVAQPKFWRAMPVLEGTVGLKSTWALSALVSSPWGVPVSPKHGGAGTDPPNPSSHLPKIYQALLLSATFSPDVEALKELVLHNPVSGV